MLGRSRLRAGLIVWLAVVSIVAPAAGDLATFNSAVKASDYTKAAAEAAATWPTLDKSRSDIGVIAREFGFAALVAKDYSAAKSYASFAVEHESGDFQLVAVVLQCLAEHNASADDQTRSNLQNALIARVERPGVDAVSLVAADTVVSANINVGRWFDTRRSADAAAKMMESGGDAFLPELRRFQLLSKVAAFFEKEKMEDSLPVRDHKALIGQDIEAAVSEDAAKRLVPIYWQTTVWAKIVEINLGTTGKSRNAAASGATTQTAESFPRLARLTNQEPPGCVLQPNRQNVGSMPATNVKKHMGAVVLQVDVDSRGKASNPRVLAAVPEDSPFIQLYLNSADDWTYKPGRPWDSKCNLARSGYTFTLSFERR